MKVSGQGFHLVVGRLDFPSGVPVAAPEPFVPDTGDGLVGDGHALGNEPDEVAHLGVVLILGRPEVQDAEQVVGVQCPGDGGLQGKELGGVRVHTGSLGGSTAA